MATISALAVRLSLNAAGFTPATVQAASNITHIGNAAVATQAKMRGLNQEAEKSEGIFRRTANSIRENASALLGLAAGGSVAYSIKAAADAEQELYKGAQQNIGATQTLTNLVKSLKAAVEGMYASFGKAFIESSNLKDGVIVLTGIFDSLRPAAAFIGSAIGTIAGWFISLGKAMAPVFIAFKVFAVVVGVATKVLHMLLAIGIARWIAGFLGLKIGALAFQGAMLLVKAAYMASTYAVAIFHAISGPKGWAILAAGAVAAAAAIYGVTKAYESAAEAGREANAAKTAAQGFTATDLAADEKARAKEAAEMQKEYDKEQEKHYQEAVRAAEKIAQIKKDMNSKLVGAFDAVRLDTDTLGLGEGARQAMALRQELELMNREVGQRGLTADQWDSIEYLQARYEELEVRKSMLKITEEIAAIEKEGAQAGLTKGQRMLDDLERLGATQQQIAAAKIDADKLDAIETQKKNAEDAKRVVEESKRLVDGISPFDKYKKQAADISRLLAVGALKPADAERAAKAAGLGLIKTLHGQEAFKVENPKALLKGSADAELAADKMKTPFEKFTEVQQQQLAECRKIAVGIGDQLEWEKQNQMKVAQF